MVKKGKRIFGRGTRDWIKKGSTNTREGKKKIWKGIEQREGKESGWRLGGRER